MRSTTLLMAIACCAISGVASAQKAPVYLQVTSQETDQVGRQVLAELKGAIRNSASLRLVEDKKAFPYLKVSAVNLEAAKGITAISYSYVYESDRMPLAGAFITSTVQHCGSERVVPCARAVVAEIEGALEVLGKYEPKLRQTLK